MGGGRTEVGAGGSEGRELFDGAGRALGAVLERLWPLRGGVVRVEWRPGLRVRRGRLESGGGPGPAVHGASYPRRRVMVLEAGLRRKPGERARVFVHEVFHFVWVRLGNAERRSWEEVLAGELAAGVRGELGWSAEWRKEALGEGDGRNRTRRWREYACESFCDTAAWLWAGLEGHDEFTLDRGARAGRRRWFLALRRHHRAGWRI